MWSQSCDRLRRRTRHSYSTVVVVLVAFAVVTFFANVGGPGHSYSIVVVVLVAYAVVTFFAKNVVGKHFPGHSLHCHDRGRVHREWSLPVSVDDQELNRCQGV